MARASRPSPHRRCDGMPCCMCIAAASRPLLHAHARSNKLQHLLRLLQSTEM